MRSNSFAILTIFCLSITEYSYSQPQLSQYLFQHFDTDDGLPSNFSNAVIQDSLGFLWFLHDNGLSRYDGYHFKNYFRDSSDHMRMIGDTRTGMLVLDKSGNPWIINQQLDESSNPTLSRYDRAKDTFIKYIPDIKHVITHVSFDKDRPIVWMGTLGHGLFSFDTKSRVTRKYSNPEKKTARQADRFIFLHDQDSSLLLGSGYGIWQFDKATESFSRPVCPAKDSSLLYHSTIVFILSPQEEPGSLWLIMVGPSHRLVKVDKTFSVIHLETHDPLDGEVAALDREGSLWFTTHTQGLFKYDPNDSTMTRVGLAEDDRIGLRSAFLRGLTIDRDQNIWVTTNDRGISKIRKQAPVFYRYAFEGEVTGRAIYQIKNRDYLLLTRSDPSRNGEIEILSAEITPDGLDAIKFQKSKVRLSKATEDQIRINQIWKGRRYLWMGTWNHGLFNLPINKKTGMIESAPIQKLQPSPNNPNTINSWFTTGMIEDSSGYLWIGTGVGLNRIDTGVPYGERGSVTHYRHDVNDPHSISDDMVLWGFHPNDDNSFWLITSAGIDLFQEGTFTHYFKNENCLAVVRDSKGGLVIGTSNGLYESTNPYNQFRNIAFHPFNRYGAFGIQEDELSRLWITNHHGLACYERQENNIVVFTKTDGLDYARDWIGKTSTGIMVTSDPHGICLFDPLSLRINTKTPSVVLMHLTVNNKPTLIGNSASLGDTSFITKDITVLDNLVLEYWQTDFSLSFSAMEMASPQKILYRHKLDGYDAEWVQTESTSRTATYTNLDAGKYVFRVKATNSEGVWSNNDTTLSILILPAPWRTWWAYGTYILILAGVMLYWRDRGIKRMKLKQRAEHLAELDMVKTRFFANISHEFRTPITLILGPLQELYNKAVLEDDKALLRVMIRNGKRLLRLINQLLDLSKLESGKVVLHPERIVLGQFLHEIASSYEMPTMNKTIKLQFHPNAKELTTYADREKMEKAIHNILFNALKFTKPGGEVVVGLRSDENHSALISIKDTGIGIPENELPKIFDRFYQVDNSQTRAYEGSGLGLALAKEMVELHHGTITCETLEGKGTTFTLQIPIVHRQTSANLVNPARRTYPSIPPDGTMMENNVEPSHTEFPPSSRSSVILLVEDNLDMRQYIRRALSKNYHVREAENGKAAIRSAQEIVPDLIISDIMMPEMDGYEFCQSIKSNELTSHIPVILLTAKADRQSKLTGLKTGADDYLCKPFDGEELNLIVRNHLEERRKLKELFSREIRLEPKRIAISSMDERFLQKVLDIIDSHMDDENFSVTDLSEEVGYSHIHVYRKLKALSGQTPNEFLRTIRLKRAAQMLGKKSDNVTQIAYSVGFRSQSYFIKCFKQQFGITPGQFIDRTNS